MSRNKQVEKNLAKTIHAQVGVGVCKEWAIKIKKGSDTCVFDLTVDGERGFVTFYVWNEKMKVRNRDAEDKYMEFLNENGFELIEIGGGRPGKKVNSERYVNDVCEMITRARFSSATAGRFAIARDG